MWVMTKRFLKHKIVIDGPVQGELMEKLIALKKSFVSDYQKLILSNKKRNK